eukprot:1322852-Amphidinium_carterae.1
MPWTKYLHSMVYDSEILGLAMSCTVNSCKCTCLKLAWGYAGDWFMPSRSRTHHTTQNNTGRSSAKQQPQCLRSQ